jgi:hypothetical protein
VPDATTTVNVTFTLDGAPAKPFFHAPDSSSTILYNTSVFVQDGLQNVPHQLVMTPTGGSVSSLFLFDYAMYTYVVPAFGSLCTHDSIGLTTLHHHLPDPIPALPLPPYLRPPKAPLLHQIRSTARLIRYRLQQSSARSSVSLWRSHLRFSSSSSVGGGSTHMLRTGFSTSKIGVSSTSEVLLVRSVRLVSS